MFNLQRLDNETAFEHELRLCLAKTKKDIDLDWQEIVDVLGLDVSADHLRKTAYGYSKYHEYMINGNGSATRILCISDTHVPFHKPVETFSDYVDKVDILIINGDVVDMQSISKFPKAYRVSVMEEIIKGRKFLIDLIDYIHPKKMIVNYGNHDIRFQSYMSRNLDSDALELMPSTVLDLIINTGFTHYDKREHSKNHYEPLCKTYPNVEIEYTENWFNQVGDAIFAHPMAFKSGMMETARQAMTYFRNEGYSFKNLVMAHTHRVGRYEIGNTTIFEQGACCETKKMHYSDGRLTDSQKEGFLYILQDKDGRTLQDKVKLVCLN